VRAVSDPADGWALWRDARDRLFLDHPQSPFTPEARDGFDGLDLYDFDPSLRVLGTSAKLSRSATRSRRAATAPTPSRVSV